MTTLLKDSYNKELIQSIGERLKSEWSKFNKKEFLKSTYTNEFLTLELKDRMRWIAKKMNDSLPIPYKQQIEFIKPLAPHYPALQGIIFPEFVHTFGLEDPTTSIEALEYLTQYSTGEFAIRPFLIKYPKTIDTMVEWSKHKNFHVRRLASEGTRPLLPWAPKLPEYIKDPTPILPILENLKNDPEDYVYRSVANNLNDISKDHPELALNIAEKWIGSSDSANWAAKHGMRTLLKKGHPDAMKLFGFGDISAIQVQDFNLENHKIKIGEFTRLNIKLLNSGKSSKFRIEYMIHYLKKNGKHNTKVFQIAEKQIKPNEKVDYSKKLDFKDLSTRKHYAGQHFVSLSINGNRLNKLEFELV
ncbi:MAG: DNA alkylation repair protein [Crocinitomicaceae bacterium]|nr:DNA alkylation repair protein [Crocinitomicaceae bacterium]